MQGFGWEKRERDHWEDLSVGGSKIFIFILLMAATLSVYH